MGDCQDRTLTTSVSTSCNKRKISPTTLNNCRRVAFNGKYHQLVTEVENKSNDMAPIQHQQICDSHEKDEIMPETTTLVNWTPLKKFACAQVLKQISPINPTLQVSLCRLDPDMFVKSLFQCCLGFLPYSRGTLQYQSSENPNSFFPSVSDDNLENYTSDLVSAVRSNDLESLRNFHASGRSLSCCNQFGESILHMACRRGFSEISSLLIEEADVSVRIIDDCGRTPLHDALWNKDCKFEIVDRLIRSDPSLLLFSDKRGHTPFSYARKEHWPRWIKFLWCRKEYINEAIHKKTMERFRQPDMPEVDNI